MHEIAERVPVPGRDQGDDRAQQSVLVNQSVEYWPDLFSAIRVLRTRGVWLVQDHLQEIRRNKDTVEVEILPD